MKLINFAIWIVIWTCIYSCIQTVSDEIFSQNYKVLEEKIYMPADSFKVYFPKLDSIYKVTKNEKVLWLSYQIKGIVKRKENDYQEAIPILQKSIEVAQKIKIDSLECKGYHETGLCYKEIGEVDKAFENYYKALKIYEKYKNEKGILRIKINLSNLYFSKGDMKQAKALLDEVVNTKHNKLRLIAMHTLANYYGSQGLIDSALYIDNLIIDQNIGDINELELSPFYNNKALCYLEKNETDSALFYTKKSFEIDSLNRNPRNMGANVLTMAQIVSKNKEYSKSIVFSNQALNIFKKVDSKTNIASAYLEISKTYQALNNWHSAFIYKDSFMHVMNEVNSISRNNKIEALKIAHETYKKDNIIKEQSSRLKLHRVILFLLSLFAIFMGVLYYFISKNNKTKKSFKQQQILFDSTQEVQNIERERIARDLHDSIGQKLSVVKMQMSMHPNLDATSQLLDEAIQDIREITHDLTSTELSKGLIVGLRHLCEQINYSNAEPHIHLQIENTFMESSINEQKSIFIYRIIQELINNTLKYAKAKVVTITLSIENDFVVLKFIDDGIGFDPQTIEQQNGIGLKNIKGRINELYGSFELRSSAIHRGAHFEIKIPIF